MSSVSTNCNKLVTPQHSLPHAPRLQRFAHSSPVGKSLHQQLPRVDVLDGSGGMEGGWEDGGKGDWRRRRRRRRPHQPLPPSPINHTSPPAHPSLSLTCTIATNKPSLLPNLRESRKGVSPGTSLSGRISARRGGGGMEVVEEADAAAVGGARGRPRAAAERGGATGRGRRRRGRIVCVRGGCRPRCVVLVCVTTRRLVCGAGGRASRGE